MTTWRGTLRSAFAEAWALVAPVECAGCGALDRALCGDCAPGLHSRLLRADLELGATTLPLVAALPYEGVARRVLLALKYEGRTELARALAAPLDAAVTAAWQGSSADMLVPVPGSRVGSARRGFEPVALIVRCAGLEVTRAVRATSGRLEQKVLTLEQRLATTGQHWRASARVRGRRVLLVDDVVTSGATLRATARAVREAGGEVVGCAAIAATPRRQGVSSIPWRFIVDNIDERR